MPAFDMSALPSIPFEAYKTLPPVSAVYFCLTDRRLVLYIGSTWHLRRRWCNHHHRARLALQGVRTIAWMPCLIAQLDTVELPLIAHFQPPLNKFRSRPRGPQNSVTVSERQCTHCGQSFYIRPSQLAHSACVYCSQRCASEGKRGRTWAKKVERVCGYCQSTFTIEQSRVRTGEGLFCSQRCSSRASVTPPDVRFWSRVTRCQHGPWCLYCCWIWHGQVDRYGYGKLWVWSQKKRAHMYSWELHNRCDFLSDNRTWVIRHLCHTRLCVNPWHLMKGTYQENRRDRLWRQRQSTYEELYWHQR